MYNSVYEKTITPVLIKLFNNPIYQQSTILSSKLYTFMVDRALLENNFDKAILYTKEAIDICHKYKNYELFASNYKVSTFVELASAFYINPIATNAIAKCSYGVDKVFVINCFGKFDVFKSILKKDTLHFRTTKSKELLAFMLHINRPVTKDEMLLHLFGQTDAEFCKLLDVTIYYLRKLFSNNGVKNIIYFKDKMYHIDLTAIISPLKYIMDFSNAFLENRSPELAQILVQTIKGDYLENIFGDWADEKRKFFREIKCLAQKIVDENICEPSPESIIFDTLEIF